MKKIIICMLLMGGIGIILIMNGPKVSETKESLIEKRSIFISYIELSRYLNDKGSVEGIKNIKKIVKNVKEMGFNEIILQVRSFADAIYDSKIFPWSRMVSKSEGVYPGYDILQTFINEANNYDISIVAWINPYRIRNDENINDISVDSPAYKYLNSDVVYINKGVYFNPSSDITLKLIVDGVEELINNYKVDGILFDDYFYPDNEIDKKEYQEYLKNNAYISKDKYNLGVVSNMIKEVYEVCNKKGVKFGVSPDGNIGNNYDKVYADIYKWCSEEGYIDFIMPQVYYGFYNETKAFKSVIDEWEKIIKVKNIELRIALAFYKNGAIDNYAKSGKTEWLENDDIIMREIVLSRNLNNYGGFALFRYDYIFNEELYTKVTIKEIENMKKVLK